ncbi:deleted in malignant brain tumors 1 protein-like [Pomacea canaliculata]|uniref:deleted in malignant brain tumors 1 protein-like n=1 Tax=Pomacea canaliculata TaxID=400727 RepID=UPI000D73E0C5|nr:deleted in malignant brain tumors 1 protein-like [Pomacea canaliculata]
MHCAQAWFATVVALTDPEPVWGAKRRIFVVFNLDLYGHEEGLGLNVLAHLMCTEKEASLDQFDHERFYEHKYSHFEDLDFHVSSHLDRASRNIIVMFVATCIYSAFLLLIPCVDAQLQVRLVDGTSPWNGRLEMYNGTWGTVCVYGFGKEEAQVVCRMLGFDRSQALAMSPFTYGYDSGHLVLHNLTCTGEETSVDQCRRTGFYKQTCHFHDAIGIICNIQHTRLRLRDVYDLGPNRGRVQIDSGVGHWETVCVSSNIAARVVCRQLGLPSHAEIIRVESSYGFTGILGKVTNFLFCLGNETSLLECQHETIFSKGCRDNIIICSDSPLIILTDDSRYPLMEETDSTLRCVSKQLPLPISYSWPETAGGFPDGSSLIITRVTREHNRRRVRCEAKYSDGEVVSSDTLQLQMTQLSG